MEQRVCYRCLIRDLVNATDYEVQIGKFIKSLPDKDRAPEEIYEQRLKKCRECEKLSEGTCNACGCYVEIRAAGVKASCPYNKWEK